MPCTEEDRLAAILEVFSVWDCIRDKRARWDQGK
jgi:hypothetical protein